VHLCKYVTAAKKQLGMPFSILLELHGWWHILTAIGAYTFMALVEFLTCPEHHPENGVGFAWPVKVALEEINSHLMNGQNGFHKKHSE
jgi:dihydroceramidase